MPNLPSTQASNTGKRTPCSQTKTITEKKMEKNVKQKEEGINYSNPVVEFFNEPNNMGINTNVELTLTAGDKSISVIAQVADSGSGFYLYEDTDEVASRLGASEEEIDAVIGTVEFDTFCESAIEAAYMNEIDSPAAEGYLNDEPKTKVLFCCQMAPSYWSPVVVRKGEELCVVAVNSNTGEVKVAELDEDDLETIADQLEDKPWSDVRRASYLLSWVGV